MAATISRLWRPAPGFGGRQCQPAKRRPGARPRGGRRQRKFWFLGPGQCDQQPADGSPAASGAWRSFGTDRALFLGRRQQQHARGHGCGAIASWRRPRRGKFYADERYRRRYGDQSRRRLQPLLGPDTSQMGDYIAGFSFSSSETSRRSCPVGEQLIGHAASKYGPLKCWTGRTTR